MSDISEEAVPRRSPSTPGLVVGGLVLLAAGLVWLSRVTAPPVQRYTPPNWPPDLVLLLPTTGVVDTDDGTPQSKMQNIDFWWHHSSGSPYECAIYSINGWHDRAAPEESEGQTWQTLADHRQFMMKNSEEAQLVASNLHAKYAGRRWLSFDRVKPEADRADHTFVTLITYEDGWTYTLNIDYYRRKSEGIDGRAGMVTRAPPLLDDLDRQIARILSQARPAISPKP